MWETFAAVVSAIVGVVGLLVGWFKLRESALRRDDVLAWSTDVIQTLTRLRILCAYRGAQLEMAHSREVLTQLIVDTAALVDRGRLFFKNQIVNDYGKEKEPAYRGYRPRVLDPIVVAHKIACGWAEANEETRLRMQLLARDCVRTFVSLVQLEVGRGRTASAYTAKGGEGSDLDFLLGNIAAERVERLMRRSRVEEAPYLRR